MAATSCTIVVADASVVINFLRINRVDLLAGLPLHFTLTDHVAHEVSDRYPDQRKRLASAFDAGILSQIAVINPEELALFPSRYRSPWCRRMLSNRGRGAPEPHPRHRRPPSHH